MIVDDHGVSERARVRALLELHVLDTEPEDRFDRVVRFAQRLFDVPKVAVNLVAHDRLFTKSAVGLPLGDVRRDMAFCSHTIARPEPLVVPDLREDPRFATHPYVVSGAVRFYAGQPLAAPGGELVGVLCLVDSEPREMSEHELELLADLGRWVERELAADVDEVQAREVQRRLLPYRPAVVDGYEVAGTCIPARLVGGDYYDWTFVDDTLQLVVADVMGKGLTASVLCAGVRAMLRGASPFNPLAEAVRRTAVGMAEDFAETSTYATLFACRIEPTTGAVEYVDAGHGLTLVVAPTAPPAASRRTGSRWGRSPTRSGSPSTTCSPPARPSSSSATACSTSTRTRTPSSRRPSAWRPASTPRPRSSSTWRRTPASTSSRTT